MTILRYISTMYTALLAPVLLFILFDYRYSPKKTTWMTILFLIPIVIINGILLAILGPVTMSSLLLLTGAIPALIFFWFISKHRDFRLLFTFCFTSTIKLVVTDVTAITDFYLGNTYILMSILRFIICPVVVYIFWKLFRADYLKLQQRITKGWGIFSAIALLFNVIISLEFSVPTHITQRPEQIPAFLLLIFSQPLLHIHIVRTLHHQLKAEETKRQENILSVQVGSLLSRVEEFSAANQRLHQERHDFRHNMLTIAALTEKGDLEAIRQSVKEYTEKLPESNFVRYCDHRILDAVLASYLELAKRNGIKVTAKMAFPDILPVNETELATAIANALENAIQACEKLSPSKRYIEIKSITAPCFMLQIRNSFDGVIAFDEEGIPLSARKDHGFGTRSIATFCNKHDAFCEFKSENKEFTLRFVFNS